MPVGRPTGYKKEYCAKVSEYLTANKDSYSKKGKLTVSLPTVDGFAVYIGVSRRVVYKWKDEHEEFMHSLDELLTEQKKRLLDSGLSGAYNSTIAKLVLSSNHGMREKSDITSDDKPMGVMLDV